MWLPDSFLQFLFGAFTGQASPSGWRCSGSLRFPVEAGRAVPRADTANGMVPLIERTTDELAATDADVGIPAAFTAAIFQANAGACASGLLSLLRL